MHMGIESLRNFIAELRIKNENNIEYFKQQEKECSEIAQYCRGRVDSLEYINKDISYQLEQMKGGSI